MADVSLVGMLPNFSASLRGFAQYANGELSFRAKPSAVAEGGAEESLGGSFDRLRMSGRLGAHKGRPYTKQPERCFDCASGFAQHDMGED